jgi:hypothetical protein
MIKTALLNIGRWTNLAIAILGAVLGICSIKHANIGKSIEKSRAQEIDAWSNYQAVIVRHDVFLTAADKFLLELPDQARRPDSSALRARALSYRTSAKEENRKAANLKGLAEKYEADVSRDSLKNLRFRVAEVTITMALFLLAAAEITKKNWLAAAAMLLATLALLGAVLALAT